MHGSRGGPVYRFREAMVCVRCPGPDRCIAMLSWPMSLALTTAPTGWSTTFRAPVDLLDKMTSYLDPHSTRIRTPDHGDLRPYVPWSCMTRHHIDRGTGGKKSVLDASCPCPDEQQHNTRERTVQWSGLEWSGVEWIGWNYIHLV